MTIREATLSDFREIGEACAEAFMDEELYGGLKHPYRKEYPEDFITYFSHKIASHWFDPSRVILVSVDDTSGRVVGMADWERQGVLPLPPFPASHPRSPLNPINLPLAHAIPTTVNRAADLPKLTILDDCAPLIAHHWSGNRSNNWSLDLLAVHPAFEGKGHGKQLVNWGITKAKEAGIVTSVVSADQKDGFYERLGFKKVGMADVGALKENGMKGGVIMFIDI